jgi:hypothetical protein
VGGPFISHRTGVAGWAVPIWESRGCGSACAERPSRRERGADAELAALGSIQVWLDSATHSRDSRDNSRGPAAAALQSDVAVRDKRDKHGCAIALCLAQGKVDQLACTPSICKDVQ